MNAEEKLTIWGLMERLPLAEILNTMAHEQHRKGALMMADQAQRAHAPPLLVQAAKLQALAAEIQYGRG